MIDVNNKSSKNITIITPFNDSGFVNKNIYQVFWVPTFYFLTTKTPFRFLNVLVITCSLCQYLGHNLHVDIAYKLLIWYHKIVEKYSCYSNHVQFE